MSAPLPPPAPPNMTARAKAALPTRRPDGSIVAPPRNDYVDERPSTIDVSRFMEDQSWPPTRKEDYLKAMNAILGQKELSPLGLRRIQDGLAILTPDDFFAILDHQRRADAAR